jgi:hypothetical protein
MQLGRTVYSALILKIVAGLDAFEASLQEGEADTILTYECTIFRGDSLMCEVVEVMG